MAKLFRKLCHLLCYTDIKKILLLPSVEFITTGNRPLIRIIMTLLIDPDNCTRCGICTEICPMKIISPSYEDTFPQIPDEKAARCIRCGQCEAFCPAGALTKEENQGEELQIAWNGKSLSPELLGTYMKSRRSIRHYKSDPVDKKTIESILDTARYAASGGNSQPVEWLVIYNPEEVRTIAGITVDWMKTLVETSHPMSEYVSGFITGWERGVDMICRDAPHLLIAHIPEDNYIAPVDAVIALTHVDIIAPSFGVGTCWAGFVANAAINYPPLREALSLPKGRIPAYAMMLGYPRYRPAQIPTRNPLAVTWRE